ncbi:MAG: cupredoxin domain-containing protein [Patescibacteria group bacterium]
MSKNVTITLVVVIVVVVVGLLGWYFLKEDSTNKNSGTSTQTTNTVEIIHPPENTVWIVNGSFTPAVLTVEVGEKVTWVNKDEYVRRVASDPHPTGTNLPELESNDLNKDESFSFSFTEAGEWGYHDYLNPVKRGKIIVE